MVGIFHCHIPLFFARPVAMGGERASTTRLRLAGQDLLQLQGFLATAAYAGARGSARNAGRLRIEAEGLSTLHVADWLALPIPRGGFEDAFAEEADLACSRDFDSAGGTWRLQRRARRTTGS